MHASVSQMDIYPVHVAYRGFQHGLPLSWIYRNIEQALKDGQVKPRTYILWPAETPLSARFTRKLLEGWKRQYDEGARMDIPQKLRKRIDQTLGFHQRNGNPKRPSVLPDTRERR